MITAANNHFYDALPANKTNLGNLLLNQKLFHEIPADWHVIITDIKGSTNAVLGGQHEKVNLVATGSIVTVLNIAFDYHITIPFFFGGDGATFIVPPNIIDKVMQALALYRVNTLNNFNLELRTGKVSVAEIYAKEYHLHIAKFCSSRSFNIPVLLGNGLNYAEKLIKGDDALLSDHPIPDDELNLSGMQCRWDRIDPPENKEEVVTLLVVAKDGIKQSASFSKVMNKIDELYGSPRKRQPISIKQLKLKTTFSSIGEEMRFRLGQIKWFELVKTWLVTLYGFIYFRTQSGRRYLKSLVEMADTLVIDGKINTVISGTINQRKALQQALDELEQEGAILYGLHISTASIMSCYVRDLKDGHIHFVDGSEGGYTQAAKMLKEKF
ncbi:DUF3095 domain-containing protein [Mucilaginibacter phyllosphaerae]|uniref:DUF3095 domain-containing protein n=1 Tax=Mucilaginibacter phyllosphaerae TaxID=1812349 RepID=A0A4Y8A783_9SPHI|nr:DUF3095 domain-containing protein [Mucilaginibacter phyllosphaerae]MBB3970831.1 hypothetical protein [Mucilaginibacter phyllosphaerae]TEW64232.1 DUF3095 domain-containing protein [Mucilaginibacter phyllosphaerae]GGH04870.1 hypothetical protein GCM10007352_08340 [Mucilaginibacter phyllosphaerae]